MGNQNCCGLKNIQNNQTQLASHMAREEDQNIDKQNIVSKNKSVLSNNIIASKNKLKQSHTKQQTKSIKQISKKQIDIVDNEDNNKQTCLDLFNYIKQCSSKQQKRRKSTILVNIDTTSFMRIKQTPIYLQYEMMDMISKGEEGQVYRAKYILFNQMRAIKKIHKVKINEQQKIKLVQQFEFLQKLDHPNIIKLYDFYEDTYSFYISTQLCEGGNLLNILNTSIMTMQTIKNIMYQLLSAINYMHQLNILHRDIKLQNILINKKFNDIKKQIPQIKLIDFDLSIDLTLMIPNDKGQFPSLDVAGTLIYMPPEALSGFFNINWDVWSCGIVLWMLLTKKMPYKFKNDHELKKCILQSKFQQKYYQNIDKQAKSFLNLLLQPNNQKRWQAAKLLQHKWFNNIRNNNNLSKQTYKAAANNIMKYNRNNNLISVVQSFMISKSINQQKRQKLAQLFNGIDKDRSGIIQIAELKKFMIQGNVVKSEEEMDNTLKMIDKDGSAIMYDRKYLFTKQSIQEAFQYYDIDRSGDINRQQLKSMLKGVDQNQIQQIFQQVDLNTDNKITRDQWQKYILKQTGNN